MADRIVWRSRPFSHCGFPARPGLPDPTAQRFVAVLASVDPPDDAGRRNLMEAIRGAEVVGTSPRPGRTLGAETA